ncbi:probable b-ketoadipate enol-lactone hydrolase protein [Oceanicola granulosus HTCC2516]|uniref:Probable b-ketoadipate enol-lactone hydrolase protein n=1 Tax=Oceanicola granulosus (strain ATCC BAA-861 / DSM 15982 / KCTC 12143 / HTCC2516) TaxID=314256 RepID=Q2CGP8_OCEGH|nr:alpha/beta hydrolase [Oceanicola granulosus]EAR51887.1 probable b-ketoadipate enol-lactone hydrolase protein [Oceanicola granulosus HTCC2516]
MKSEHQATAPDGTALRYVIWRGGAAKHRVALVHSLAMRAEFWEATAAALGDDWEVLALDCRGHGASGKPAGPYAVEQFADDLAAVLDDAGWDAAVIGGASMGGCVAQAFCARHGARTRALGLFDTTAWYGETAPADWEGRGQKARAEGLAALTGFQKTRWFSDHFREANPGLVEETVAVFTANDPDAYLETCRMLGRADLRDALPGVSVPAAVVVGEEDYATPIPMAKDLARAIPGATYEVLPGVRHLSPLEVPEKIAATLAALVEGVPG